MNPMPLVSRRALAVILAVGLSAAAASPASAGTEIVLHAFQGGSDGDAPFGALVTLHGAIYGTTGNGGSTNNGTVFSMTPAGVETVLYSFAGGRDGAGPNARLVKVGSKFYGTTYSGGGKGCTGNGAVGCGTVFSVTPTGVERVLYRFTGGSDGAHSYSDVVNLNGTLYGTTAFGGGTGCGGSGCGTVFSVTTAGVETVLYAFKGGSDGALPIGGLLDDGGTLYGATSEGVGVCIGQPGCGTVFSVTTAGVETVLYAFKGGKEGYHPTGDLLNYGGTLYGADSFGATRNGDGAVFSVTTAGVENVVYAFKQLGSLGAGPNGGLVELNGKLYGTTYNGGADGMGTVFSLTSSGDEEVVYSFQGGSDGAFPAAGLMKMNGTLYGTTQVGGGGTCGNGLGCGTVFSVTP